LYCKVAGGRGKPDAGGNHISSKKKARQSFWSKKGTRERRGENRKKQVKTIWFLIKKDLDGKSPRYAGESPNEQREGSRRMQKSPLLDRRGSSLERYDYNVGRQGKRVILQDSRTSESGFGGGSISYCRVSHGEGGTKEVQLFV